MTGTKDKKSRRRFHADHYKTQRRRGFTLLGLLIEIIIIALVYVGLLERLQYYQEYAEKTVMEVTVRNMRTGLQLRVADLMMHDQMKEAGHLLRVNPITWLEAPPPNYLGELKAPQDVDIPRGNWYFNLSRQELTYLPEHRRFFESGSNEKKSVRYRVTAMKYSPGKNEGDEGQPEGIALSLVDKYTWNVAIR